MVRAARLVLLPVVLGALLLACSDRALPGAALGTYKVEATAQSNTCGAGIGAPSPWEFSVEMSRSGSTLYWSWMDGSPLLSGTLTSANQASITNTQTGNVDGTDGGLGPCTMQRADQLAIAFGPGTPPGSFTGSITYSFTVPTGADCTDQLRASGGPFDALPCTLVYATTGSLK